MLEVPPFLPIWRECKDVSQFCRLVHIAFEKATGCPCPLIPQIFLLHNFDGIHKCNKTLIANLLTAARISVACNWKSKTLANIDDWLTQVNHVMLMNQIICSQ